MKKELAFTKITRRDEHGEESAGLDLTKEEFEQIVNKHTNGHRDLKQSVSREKRMEEIKFEHEKLKNLELLDYRRVDTDGFEKGIVLFANWITSIEKQMRANKKLRIVIDYDAELLKADMSISRVTECG